MGNKYVYERTITQVVETMFEPPTPTASEAASQSKDKVTPDEIDEMEKTLKSIGDTKTPAPVDSRVSPLGGATPANGTSDAHQS
jgi:hypothetical protein